MTWDNPIFNDIFEAMEYIEKLDKEMDYKRLSFILRHDPNRGYDQELLEELK